MALDGRMTKKSLSLHGRERTKLGLEIESNLELDNLQHFSLHHSTLHYRNISLSSAPTLLLVVPGRDIVSIH